MLNLKKTLKRILEELNKKQIIREVSFNYTIAANSTYNTNLKTLIDNDIPSGYTFGGLCGYSSNNIQVLTNNFGYYSSNYSLQLINRSTSAIGSTLYRIWYIAIPN